jgi:hypothetical protein
MSKSNSQANANAPKAVDWTKPIQTVSGCPARLLGVLSGLVGDCYIVAHVPHGWKAEVCNHVNAAGSTIIINVPEKKVRAKLYVTKRRFPECDPCRCAFNNSTDVDIFTCEMPETEAKERGLEYEVIV